MTIAFLYSGQGSQVSNMYQNFYRDPVFKDTIQRLSSSSKVPILKLGLETRDADINGTRVAQPLIIAYQMAITNVLNSYNIYADITAGMSLGQYSALAEADVLNEKEILEIVDKRAEYMAIDSQSNKTEMLALVGKLVDILKALSEEEFKNKIFLSNINSDMQVVVGGKKDDILEFQKRISEKYNLGTFLLKNEGAFHTKYYNKSSLKLEKFMESFKFRRPSIPVIDNGTGQISKVYNTKILSKHMTNLVDWKSSMDRLVDYDVDMIIEIGPGRQLLKMMKDSNFNGKKVSIESLEDIKKLGEFYYEKSCNYWLGNS